MVKKFSIVYGIFFFEASKLQKHTIMEISIKKPCHENWDAMTPNEQGAFCGKCVKTVIDFSSKSIEDIKVFFAVKHPEKVCGRFEKTQLTALSFDSFFNEFKGLNITKRFAVIIYLTFGMWLFNASAGVAQNPIQEKGDVKVDHSIMGGVRAEVHSRDTAKTVIHPIKTNSTFINGKVKCVEKEAVEKPIKMGEVSVLPNAKPKSIKPIRSIKK